MSIWRFVACALVMIVGGSLSAAAAMVAQEEHHDRALSLMIAASFVFMIVFAVMAAR